MPAATKPMRDEYRAKKEALIINTLKQSVFVPVEVGTRTLKAIPPEVQEEMLKDENARLFLRAFTHESYDMENSYDQLEFMGDLVANVLIGNGIVEKYPNLDEEQLTNMLSHYKSNKVFGEVILETIPNLDSLILIDGEELTIKIYADVFEALIRAVYVTANTVRRGIGFACAENIYKILTRNFRYDLKYAAGNPKSVVLEIFDKEGTVTERPGKNEIFNSGDTITVTVDTAAIQAFNKILNPNSDTIPVERLIGRGSGPDRETARTRAYESILETLSGPQYKITPQIFQEAKQRSIIREFPNHQAVERISAKRNESLTFSKKNSKTPGMVDWKLIAQSKLDGKKRLVSKITVSKDSRGFNPAKIELLERYVNKGV